MKTQRVTPLSVIKRLFDLADISLTDKVLEPSAGEGAILDYIKSIYPNKKNMLAFELNADKVNILKEKGYDAHQKDFLDLISYNYNTFDVVIAAPPFKNNVDVLHIMHMYKCLVWEKSARVVSLTSPFWLTNNEKHQVLFRQWLENKKYLMEMLPDNTFIEKGKTVPTAIIKIWR